MITELLQVCFTINGTCNCQGLKLRAAFSKRPHQSAAISIVNVTSEVKILGPGPVSPSSLLLCLTQFPKPPHAHIWAGEVAIVAESCFLVDTLYLRPNPYCLFLSHSYSRSWTLINTETYLHCRYHIEMCGISCVLALQNSRQHLHETGSLPNGAKDAAVNGGADRATVSKELDESLEMIKHRGPDSKGQWISSDGRVGPLTLTYSRSIAEIIMANIQI